MKKIKLTRIIAFLALSLSIASTAMGTTTPITLGDTTDFHVQLAQFNDPNSFLKSVELTIEGTYNRTLTVENNEDHAIATGTWSINPYSISIVSPANATIENDSDYDFIGFKVKPDKTALLTVNDTFTNVFTFTDPAILSFFTGIGMIDLTFTGTCNDIITVNGDKDATPSLQSAFKEMKFSHQYNYTPAPLPSALIFLISGLAAVVGFKRFKAARA